MTTPAGGLPTRYRFADLTLDTAQRRVTRQGQPIELKALDFDLLRFLAESAPNVVNADLLAEKVWGRHFVSPENVAQRVMLVRQHLGDDANRPRYIETIRNKGYRLIPIVESLPADEASEGSSGRRVVAATAAALLAVAVAAAVWYSLAGTTERAPPSPSSVAVVPFDNLSPDLADAYFALGMQDEIVNQLTKISELRVFPVRPEPGAQQPIPDAARNLDVATVLGGSVHHAAGRVRVNTQLIAVSTGESLWSSSYEREFGDIFAIQSEVALDVASALRLELSPAERARVERVPTTNVVARDLYLVARTRNPLSAEVLSAIAEIEEALALDPEFEEAWVIDAHVRNFAQFVEPGRAAEHRLRAEHAARRALALDPDLGSAHAALGWTLQTKRDWVGAEAAYRNAEALNVPWAEMGSYASLQLSTGKPDARVRYVYEEARAAEPQIELYHRFLAFVHEMAGDSVRARAVYENGLRTFERDPRATFNIVNQQMHWLVGRNELEAARAITIDDPLSTAMLDNLGQPDEALAILRREYEAGGGSPVRHRDIGLWAGHFGDPLLAFDAMHAAIDAQSAQILYLWLPQLAPMRRLPAFRDYLRATGLVAYWQEYGWPSFCRPLAEHDFACD
jgi:TolB-like protein/DNA-binding winged helix-turn-helix (wHTH) protein